MSLTLTATLRGHAGAVWGLSFSKAGLLASCGVDKTVRVWARSEDGKTWTCVATTADELFRRTVRSLAWGTDGRSLAAACFDGVATVLELTGGPSPDLTAAVSLSGHESEVKGVAFSGSGGLLATCSRDRSVWIWEVGPDFDYECIAVLNGHAADVKGVAWHPGCELLVSCGYDAVAKVWVEDEDDWFCAETLAAHDDTVWAAAFSPKGERLATCSADSSVVLWNRESPHSSLAGAQPSFKVIARCPDVHEGPVYSCGFGADGRRIVTGGGDDCIAVLEKVEDSDGKKEACNGGADAEGETGAVDMTEDAGDTENRPKDANGIDGATNADAGDALSLGSTSKEGATGSVVTSKERWAVTARSHRAHSGDVNCVVWYPGSNSCLASCGDDGLVRIWKYSVNVSDC